MKSLRKNLAKHVLHSGADELDFSLIGISCADDQYRVTTLVNDSLGTALFLSDYVPLNLKSGRLFTFSLYRYSDDELGLDYYLVPNASNFEGPGAAVAKEGDLFSGQELDERTLLIKELPKTDYFFMLKGESQQHFLHDVCDRLRRSGAFTRVEVIDPLSLPSRKNLVF